MVSKYTKARNRPRTAKELRKIREKQQALNEKHEATVSNIRKVATPVILGKGESIESAVGRSAQKTAELQASANKGKEVNVRLSVPVTQRLNTSIKPNQTSQTKQKFKVIQAQPKYTAPQRQTYAEETVIPRDAKYASDKYSMFEISKQGSIEEYNKPTLLESPIEYFSYQSDFYGTGRDKESFGSGVLAFGAGFAKRGVETGIFASEVMNPAKQPSVVMKSAKGVSDLVFTNKALEIGKQIKLNPYGSAGVVAFDAAFMAGISKASRLSAESSAELSFESSESATKRITGLSENKNLDVNLQVTKIKKGQNTYYGVVESEAVTKPDVIGESQSVLRSEKGSIKIFSDKGKLVQSGEFSGVGSFLEEDGLTIGRADTLTKVNNKVVQGKSTFFSEDLLSESGAKTGNTKYTNLGKDTISKKTKFSFIESPKYKTLSIDKGFSSKIASESGLKVYSGQDINLKLKGLNTEYYYGTSDKISGQKLFSSQKNPDFIIIEGKKIPVKKYSTITSSKENVMLGEPSGKVTIVETLPQIDTGRQALRTIAEGLPSSKLSTPKLVTTPRVSQNNVSNTKLVSISKSKETFADTSILDVRPSKSIAEVSKVKSDVTIIPEVKIANLAASGSKTASKVATIEISSSVQEQAPLSVVEPKLGLKSLNVQPTLPKEFIIPTLSSDFSSAKRKDSSLFSLEVGKKGNKIFRSFDGLSLLSAAKKGKRFALGSAAASFRIKKKGGGSLSFDEESKVFDLLGGTFRRSKTGDRFVQRRQFRITSLGEKRDIRPRKKRKGLLGGLL